MPPGRLRPAAINEKMRATNRQFVTPDRASNAAFAFDHLFATKVREDDFC